MGVKGWGRVGLGRAWSVVPLVGGQWAARSSAENRNYLRNYDTEIPIRYWYTGIPPGKRYRKSYRSVNDNLTHSASRAPTNEHEEGLRAQKMWLHGSIPPFWAPALGARKNTGLDPLCCVHALKGAPPLALLCFMALAPTATVAAPATLVGCRRPSSGPPSSEQPPACPRPSSRPATLA